jgi:excinuclease UvrABC nuclease subunit
MRTALYRHFDAAGVLLYVGISLSAVQRLGQHRQTSGWYTDIASVTIEWLHDRAAALTAEANAIAVESPLHNVQLRVMRSTLIPFSFAIEHVRSCRRDGNYAQADASEMLTWWRQSFPGDEFRLVSSPRGKVGGATGYHGVLRSSNSKAWSAAS